MYIYFDKKNSNLEVQLADQNATLAEQQAAIEEQQNTISELEQKIKEFENREIIVSPHVKVTAATLREVLAPAQELVTCKYYYTDADIYLKDKSFFKTGISVPFTQDKTVYTYTGVISGGIDLAKINIKIVDVNDDKQNIFITLPQPEIFHNEIDFTNFQIYDIRNSVFTVSSLKDYTDLSSSLKESQAKKLLSTNAFWEQVKLNAENTVRSLITTSDKTQDCNLIIKWAS